MTKALIVVSTLLALAGNAEASRSRARDRQETIAQRASFYEPYILRAASRYGVDPRLLWTIAYLESGFNPRAVSHKGARGLMQFMPRTARRYGLKNPHEPLSSIDAAARYVRHLSRLFGGRTDLVLAGYNAGEYAVMRAGYRVPNYAETRRYVTHGKLLLTNYSQTARTRTLHITTSVKQHHSRHSIYVTTRPADTGSINFRSTPTRSIHFGRS